MPKVDPVSPEAIVETLRGMGSEAVRTGMARFAIPSDNAFGIPVGDIQKLAKTLGRNHDLAAGLWETGWYEARMLAAFVDDPAAVTPAQMDRWCRDFDSWGICDTVCFHLFDRTPHAFRKVEVWATRRGEFQKRGSFALLASLALHDKHTPDDAFADCLPIIEAAATDGRNFVKKAVSWALRGTGGRSVRLHSLPMELAKRLATSTDATERWIGKDAVKDLSSPATAKRLKRRGSSEPEA
jgi:3-methyladenine DNA glycosylase AlkD